MNFLWASLLFFQISSLTVQSGKAYTVTPVTSGATVFIDRTYTFGAIPAPLLGQQFIRTANDDRTVSAGLPLLGFTLATPATVYVLYSNVGSNLESSWLTAANGWILDSFTVPSTIMENGGARLVRHKSFPAGAVALAGAGSTGSMYNVVIVPAIAPPPQTVTVAPMSWDLCGEFVATGAFDAVKAELFVDDIATAVNTWNAPAGSTFDYPVSMCRSLPGDFAGRPFKMRVVLTDSVGTAKSVTVTFP